MARRNRGHASAPGGAESGRRVRNRAMTMVNSKCVCRKSWRISRENRENIDVSAIARASRLQIMASCRRGLVAACELDRCVYHFTMGEHHSVT